MVSGGGGVGKTQLAVELVWRFGAYFQGGVFWLSMADAQSVPGEVAKNGAAMGLGDGFSKLSLTEQVSQVYSHWQDGLPRLLIFDNCEDPDLYQQWCPRGGHCHVLLTSRRADWPKHLRVKPVRLPTLPRGESVALLRRSRPDLSADDLTLHAIADTLGDLPLALHLAGSFLEQYRHVADGQPAAYLFAINKVDLLDHPSLAGPDGHSPTGHDLHVARTFLVSVNRLQPGHGVDDLARATLAHAACLSPGDPIPAWLLARILGRAEDTVLAAAINRLVNLGLVDREDDKIILHRLVAAFALSHKTDLAMQDAVEAAVAKSASAQNKSGLPGPLRPWVPHLRHVAERAADRGASLAGVLFNNLGYHLRMVADLPAAKAAYERALRIDEATYGSDHPTVANRVNNLGDVYQYLGDPPAAKAAFERALRIDEATYGPDHPTVAIRVNNLGRVYHDLGDLSAAKAAFERALRIGEATYGPDHPTVAILVNNLGSVYGDLGDLPAAKAAFGRALRIDEATYGLDHPNVARDVNNLGTVYQDLGDFPAAKAAYHRAWVIFKATYGPDHPQTQMALKHLQSLPPD